MEIKEPSCQICFNKYDSDLHCPRILPSCGHTICTTCIQNILDTIPSKQITCPFDKKKCTFQRPDKESFPKNFSLLQLIEDKVVETPDCCPIHKKKLDHVCITDKLVLCQECASTNHTGHRIQNKQQLLTEINAKVSKIEEYISLIETHPNKNFKRIESILEAREQTLKRGVDVKFSEYQSLILNKKQEILNELTHNFSLQRKNIHEKYTTLDPDSNLIQEITGWKEQSKKKISNWKYLSSNEIAYDLIDENFEKINKKIESWQNVIDNKIDIKELSAKLDLIDVDYDDAILPDAIAKSCNVKNNIDEEHKMLDTPLIDIEITKNASTAKIPSRIELTEREDQTVKDLQYIDKKLKEGKKLLQKILMAADLHVEWGKNSNETIYLKEEAFEDFFCVCVCLTPWNKKCLHYIKTIHVICEKFNDKLTKGLSNGLVALSNLNNLRIEFKRDFAASEITDNGLTKLSESLSKLIYLNELDLDFKSCERITDNGIFKLGGNIHKIPNLKRFQITFPKNGVYTDDGISKFGLSLAKISTLNHLELEFLNNRYISNDGIPSLINAVSKLHALSQIRLSLIEVDSFTDIGFNQLGQHLSSMYNLKKLRLDMTLKSDTVVCQLATMISKLINLQGIHLNMENLNRVTVNGMNQLYHSLSKLEYLNHLYVTFKHWWAIQASISNMEQTLSKLKGLKELHLELSDSWCLKDEEMVQFSSVIAKTSTLNHFSLKHDHGLTDRGVTALASGVAQLFYLNYLKFDFVGCTDISDSAIFKISASISRMTDIVHFELHFKSCPHITDNAISQISHAISQKSKLNRLILEFGDCANVTDKGFNQLTKSCQTLTALQSIKLIFNGCWKVTDEGLSILVSLFTKIKSLNNVYVDLTNCQRITDEGKQLIQKSMSSISKTKNFAADLRL